MTRIKTCCQACYLTAMLSWAGQIFFAKRVSEGVKFPPIQGDDDKYLLQTQSFFHLSKFEEGPSRHDFDSSTPVFPVFSLLNDSLYSLLIGSLPNAIEQ